MPPVSLIEDRDIRPCRKCHSHKKTHFSDLVKTHSLRTGTSRNILYDRTNKGKLSSRNRSHEFLSSIQDTDSSNSTHSLPRTLRGRIKPSHSFLHKEYVKIRGLRNANASKNSVTQEIEPDVFSVDGHGYRPKQSHLTDNEDPDYERVSPPRSVPALPYLNNGYYPAGTQTSTRNTLCRVYKRIQSNTDDVSRFIVRTSGFEDKFEPKRRFCSKSSCILVCGYLLMIIIGIVISVAVTQRDQQQFQAIPRRPTSFAGAELSLQESAPTESRRRINTNAASATAGQNFDFFDDINAGDSGAASSSIFPPFKVNDRQPAPSPVRVFPQQRPSEVEQPREIDPSSTSRQSSFPKRQGPTKNFRHQFSLQDQVDEEVPLGRKEPEVKIIKSWANTHSDGSYTWGYINTDGSFKNETRGADCVVRGIYGYVDEVTGETISFPYISGNPCNPTEPDYYYDYDEGAIKSDGVVIQARNPERETRRRLQQ